MLNRCYLCSESNQKLDYSSLVLTLSVLNICAEVSLMAFRVWAYIFLSRIKREVTLVFHTEVREIQLLLLTEKSILHKERYPI